MTLQMMKIEDLKSCPLNMRHGRKAPDVSDILPSVERYGVLQSLVVRPNCEGFEVIAGRRRLYAAIAANLAEVPVDNREDLTDADALELSLIENTHRVDPSPLQQYETFSDLIKKGKSVEDLMGMFALPKLVVERRLAIGKLIKPIRALIRADELHENEIQCLSLVSAEKQKEYIALRKANNHPVHYELRDWCFGRTEIPVSYALFDLAEYTGPRLSDLFKDKEFFQDSKEFWKLQNQAITARVEKYEGNGWEVVLFDIGQSWNSWDYTACTKKDGGRVYVQIDHDGEVKFHEGFKTKIEVQKGQNKGAAGNTNTADSTDAPTRGEIPAAMVHYFDLHRAAAVREDLAKSPKIALRFALATLICGNENVSSHSDRAEWSATDAVKESVAKATATVAFDKRRDDIKSKYGIDIYGHDLTCKEPVVAVFDTLQSMKDAEVIKTMAVVIADRLLTGSGSVDILGELLGTDLTNQWTADDVFFQGVRDKVVLRKMLIDVAGKPTADSHATATGKVMKTIIRDHLEGKNGRAKVEAWIPHYMAFPAKPYVNPFKIASLNKAAAVRKSLGKKPTSNARK